MIMAAAAGLQAAMGLGKMIAGGIQASKGKKDLAALEANTPKYQRPSEVNQAGQISRLRYLNPNMPGQGLMEQQVGQQQANTLQNIQDMGGVADIYQTQINANNALNNIGVQAASQRLQNEMNLINQLAVEADYSDKEFDTNTYIPWQEKRKSALDRIGAGTQNLFGGMDNLASMGAGLMGMAGGDKGGAANTAASQVMNLDSGVGMGQPAIDRTPLPSLKRPFMGVPATQAINNAYGFTPPQDMTRTTTVPTRLEMLTNRYGG